MKLIGAHQSSASEVIDLTSAPLPVIPDGENELRAKVQFSTADCSGWAIMLNSRFKGTRPAGALDGRIYSIRGREGPQGVLYRRRHGFKVYPLFSMFLNNLLTGRRWESGEFHLGQFHDECFKALSPVDKKNRLVVTSCQISRSPSFILVARR